MKDNLTAINSIRNVTKSDRQFAALGSVLERTAKILLDSTSVTLKMSKDGSSNIPAWTNLSTGAITITSNSLRGVDSLSDTVKVSLGLLYHECSHLLWSATLNRLDPVLVQVSSKMEDRHRVQHAHNVLDDKRIENLFVRMYKPGRFFFSYPLFEFIVKDSANNGITEAELYSHLAGRPWIDSSILADTRTLAENAKGTSWVDAVDDIVNKFNRLSLKDYDTRPGEVADLIERWIELVTEASISDTDHSCKENQPNAHDRVGYGEESPLSKTEDSLSDDDLDNLSGTGNSDGEGETKDDPKDSDEPAESGAPSNDPASSQSGSAPTLEDVISEIKDALDGVTEAMASDIKDTVKAVTETMKTIDPRAIQPKAFSETMLPVEPEMRTRSRQIAASLQEIKTTASPEWLHGETSGKLNLYRDLMMGDERLDVFDLFDDGSEDDMKMHISIGIDLSTSMSSSNVGAMPPYRTACEQAWIMRDAFCECDHDVDLYGFSYEHQLLTNRHNRMTYPVMYPDGGTDPTSMIRAIINRSSQSDADNKLAVIITDGKWSGEEDYYHRCMDAFRGIGGTSMLFLIRDGDYHMFKQDIERGKLDARHPYGVDSFHIVDTSADMVPIVKSFVAQTMKTHLNKS